MLPRTDKVLLVFVNKKNETRDWKDLFWRSTVSSNLIDPLFLLINFYLKNKCLM